MVVNVINRESGLTLLPTNHFRHATTKETNVIKMAAVLKNLIRTTLLFRIIFKNNELCHFLSKIIIMNKSNEQKKVGKEINLKDGFKILPKPRRRSSVGDIIQEMKYRLKLSPQPL